MNDCEESSLASFGAYVVGTAVGFIVTFLLLLVALASLGDGTVTGGFIAGIVAWVAASVLFLTWRCACAALRTWGEL